MKVMVRSFMFGLLSMFAVLSAATDVWARPPRSTCLQGRIEAVDLTAKTFTVTSLPDRTPKTFVFRERFAATLAPLKPSTSVVVCHRVPFFGPSLATRVALQE